MNHFLSRVILSMTIMLPALCLESQEVAMQTVLSSAVQNNRKAIHADPSPGPAIEKTTYIVRDIFRLKYGHYRDAIALIDESMKSNMMPASTLRVLTDFTGDAYRLITEMGYNSLTDYEKSLSTEMNAMAWKDWYEKFKPHVESSSREILKWVR